MNDNPTPTVRPLLKWVERLLLAGALAFVAYRLAPQIGALVGIGSDDGPATTFSVTTLDGSTLDENSLRGQVVVVNFWATWCGPCRLEMPALQSLYEDKRDAGVIVVGLSTDTGPASEIRDLLTEREITYPVGRATPTHRDTFGDIPLIPTTFILDRSGVVRHKIEGYAAGPVLRVAVDRLLHEGG